MSDVTGYIGDGTIRDKHLHVNSNFARSHMAQNTDNRPIPLSSARVWNTFLTLPGTAANDDLGFSGGDVTGTDAPCITAGDVKATSSTRYCLVEYQLSERYEDGQTLTVAIDAGMETTVTDGTCTLDCEAYRSADDGVVGADICATATQDMDSVTEATYTFTITATSLSAGDLLFLRIGIIYVDTATGTAVTPNIYKISVNEKTRG